MPEEYSGLEVAPDTTLPELYHEEKIPNTSTHAQPQEHIKHASQPSRRICSLSPKAFLLTLCGVVLVVSGAVAGGIVGGTRAAQPESIDSEHSITSPSTLSTQAPPSDLPTATMFGTQPTKTHTLVGPTQTLYRDCPSSNNTIYKALGLVEYQFRKICGDAFRWSRNDVVNERVHSLNDCIDVCAAFNVQNRTDIAAGRSSICNGVCWRSSIDSDWPGQCFGGTIQNSSDAGFPLNGDVRCDAAGWINQQSPYL